MGCVAPTQRASSRASRFLILLAYQILEKIRVPRIKHASKTSLLTGTCVAIHPGRVEPALPVELTTSRTEALQARRSCASLLETFSEPFQHRAWPKIRGLERGSMSALIVVAHVFSWPPIRLRHVRVNVKSVE